MALALFREAKDKRGEAAALNNIGNVYASTGNYSEALKVYEESLKIAKDIGDKVEEARALNNIGEVYRLTGKYREAFEAFETSLKIERESGNKAGEAETLNNIANVYNLKGEYEEALAVYEMSLKIAKEIGDRAGEAIALGNIGVVYESTGKYSQALEAYEASLTIKRELGDKLGQALTLNNIGIVYQFTGRYREALGKYEESLRIAREIGNKVAESMAVSNLGAIYQSTGDYAKALESYEASLKIERELGNKAGEAQALGNIAIVYKLTGQYAEALDAFETVLKIFQQLQMQPEIAVTLHNIGAIYEVMNEPVKALQAFEASLKIKREISDKLGEALTLNNIGAVYQSMGKHAEALGMFEESLKIARGIGHRAGEAAALSSMGRVYRLTSKYGEALKVYEESVKIAEEIGAPDIAFNNYWGIGDVHRSQKRWEPGAEAYRKAIALIEQIRAATKEPSLQMGFFKQCTEPYYGLVTCLIALNKKEEAFQVAERAKARTLVELLEGGGVDVTKVLTEEEKQQKQELEDRLAFLNAEHRYLKSQPNPDESRLKDVESRLVAARRDYDAFRRRLYLAHPELQSQQGESTPLTVAQAIQWFQALKARDVVMLEYLVGNEQTWLFALSGTGKLTVHAIRITRKELEQRVNALREAIRLKEEGRIGTLPKIETALRKLDVLLNPVSPALKGARQVCIVPDDVLWEVPFAALKMPKGQYLIEVCAVSYAPSLTALKAMSDRERKQARPAQTLLAMAPFAYADAGNRLRIREVPLRGTFSPLPASLHEVAAVSQLYGTKPYLREKANETLVKTEGDKMRILHFATHAIFEPSQGMYSCVVMAEEKGEDGFLEAREIVDLDLLSELAVLSACETARGQLSRGEGVIGLSWAFFIAGCPSIIVSQWKVQDESTAQLMSAFYRNLKAGKGKAEALRQAQLSLLRSNPRSKIQHPFYWSPFILVGDWR